MDDLHLAVPAAPEYLRAVRMVAADAAARAGLGVDEVEDFRIAADELTYAAMTATDHSVQLVFRAEPERVMVRGCASTRHTRDPVTMSELSARIVAGVCDFYDFRHEDSEIVFVAMKGEWPAEALDDAQDASR